ncbi:vesicle transport through interaction with t-SNAREs homolog 1A [Bacillus rossius redtenbacheri]|uniref:vesicle transport through interaction with t-SNAREs homolog 1A n=1 Tax=Bacillus rossius redtenbacheri TaxID=93214 RepID=UPI002FDE03A1
MGSLMADYEQQYGILTAGITAKIGRLSNDQNADRKALVLDVEKEIEEAQELLEQMELEVREVEASARPRLRSRVDSYRAELGRLSQEFMKVRSPPFQDGFFGQDDLYSGVSLNEEQKLRLLDNSERLERTGKILNTGYRIILETEDIGSQVLQDLHSQRETIQSARSRLRETDSELGRSSRLLGGMILRSLQHRAVLVVVGLVLACLVALGVYLSLSK